MRAVYRATQADQFHGPIAVVETNGVAHAEFAAAEEPAGESHARRAAPFDEARRSSRPCDRHAGDREIASAELAAARLDQDTLQREVRLQVLSGISAYQGARESADALGSAVLEAAEQTLELTRRSFAAGKVGAPAITSAQNNLIDVRRDYLDALNALIAAGTDLERATGGLVVMATGENDDE